MTALAPADREHLARILGMLGSAHAGERDAAGLAATRFLKERNATWFDVICVADESARITGVLGWRDLARACRTQPDSLRPWERGFLANLENFPRLSPKQKRVPDEIADRLGFARAAA